MSAQGSTVIATNSSKLIGTHDGTFHCDEALAVYLLRQTSTYKNAKVLRSRDESELAVADVLVDVGGVYNVRDQRFDHHQKGFEEYFSRRRRVTMLSSAGLVYREFGKEVIKAVLKEARISVPKDMDIMHQKVYDSFIEAIDAHDNGVKRYEGRQAYQSATDLPIRVSNLNAPWFAKPGTVRGDQTLNFEKAVALTGKEFTDAVMAYVENWLPAQDLVKRMYARAVKNGNGIMVMDQFCPWKSHLFELDTRKRIFYILYQDSTERGWRIQCVPAAPGSFQSRKPLPQKWRGLREDRLSQVAGIDGCVFVHAAGFIGGNKTFEGAKKMAEAALNNRYY